MKRRVFIGVLGVLAPLVAITGLGQGKAPPAAAKSPQRAIVGSPHQRYGTAEDRVFDPSQERLLARTALDPPAHVEKGDTLKFTYVVKLKY